MELGFQPWWSKSIAQDLPLIAFLCGVGLMSIGCKDQGDLTSLNPSFFIS